MRLNTYVVVLLFVIINVYDESVCEMATKVYIDIDFDHLSTTFGCRSCGQVKLPHFYCCSGDRGNTGEQDASTR